MTRLRIVRAAALGIVTALTIGASSASAATVTRVFHASNCIAQNYNASLGMSLTSIWQWTNNSTIGDGTVICPLISDSSIQIPVGAPLTATVTVSGFANGIFSDGVSAQVCAQHVGGGTAVCGAAVSSNASGVHQLTPGLPSAITAGDYVFVIVGLGVPVSGSYNTFWGYSLSNQ